MRLRHFLTVTILAVVTAACSSDTGTPVFYQDVAHYGSKADAAAARDLINGHRALKNLAPLALDPALATAAQAHADDMARHDRTGHDISEGPLKTRLAARNIAPSAWGENVAGGYRTVAEAFSGWRGSPAHNEIMLMPEARRMGIAAAYAPHSKYKVFWSLIVTAE